MEFAEQPLALSRSYKDTRNWGGKYLFVNWKDPVDQSGETQQFDQ